MNKFLDYMNSDHGVMALALICLTIIITTAIIRFSGNKR